MNLQYCKLLFFGGGGYQIVIFFHNSPCIHPARVRPEQGPARI